MKSVQTTCGYCAVGCGLTANYNDDGILHNIRGVKGYPTNDGILCPKGLNIDKPSLAADRARTAFIRKDGIKEDVSVEKGISEFVRRVRETQQKYGKDACAYYSTGQITMEDFALLGLVGRMGMGMEGDGNTRLCMASAVVAYKKTFGFDSPPFTYEDLDQSDCIVMVGANPAVAQPVLWMRYKKHAKTKDHDLIVVDPRKSETAEAATLHVPLKPKSDLIFFYTLANVLIEKGWIDREYIDLHVEHFAEFAAHVAAYKPEDCRENCGISEEVLLDVAQKIHQRKKVSFWWTMGVNQSHEAVMVASSIIALALITGNIGRPGTGANSITGQCNAMGSRLNSVTTALFGGRDFANPQHRQEVCEILGVEDKWIPRRPTLPIHKITEKIHSGEIKFLWVICTNPVQSFVSINAFKEAMGKLDTLVVQDLYHDTETAKLADIFLPATPCTEKEGTFINMERRIGPVQKILEKPEGTLTDYEIFLRIGQEYGCTEILNGWANPDEAFETLRKLSVGRPCDFSGVRDRRFLVERGGIQWPFPESAQKDAKIGPARRLFEDGQFFTPSGKAQLVFEASRPATVKPSAEYPFLALSGRGSAVLFHTNTRTGRVPALSKLAPKELYINMHPDDMAEMGLEGSEPWVRVRSSEGEFRSVVHSDSGLQKKHIFVPMHYVESNLAIASVFDPYSAQPSFKCGAVAIEKAAS
ncbi:MAG: molybdopterin-dependent oxidoreductase [Spirochaetota bacterium]